jgi:hypothetical protein
VPIVVKKGTGKTNVPKGPGTPQKPRPEAEAELLKESIGLLRGKAVSGRKTSLGWPLLRILRGVG